MRASSSTATPGLAIIIVFDLASRKAGIAATVGVATLLMESMHKQCRASVPPGLPGGGGVPLLVEGQCAGGIGISGSPPEIDDEIAWHGVACLDLALAAETTPESSS